MSLADIVEQWKPYVLSAESRTSYSLAMEIRDESGLSRRQAEKVVGIIRASSDVVEEDKEHLFLSDKYVINKATKTIVTFLKSAPKPIAMAISKHKALLQAYSNWAGKPNSINEVARQFDFPRQWLVEYLRVHGVTHDSEPFMPEEVLDSPTGELVEEVLQSKRQALYQSYEKKKWMEVQRDADEWRKLLHGVVEPLTRYFADAEAPPIPKVDRKRLGKDKHAVFVHATDHHIGLRTSLDSRDPYDLKEAKKRLQEHTIDLINKCSDIDVEVVHIGIGGDSMHFDGIDHRTTLGQPQDSDLTWEEAVRETMAAAIWQIEAWRNVAPVEAVIVPGNHAKYSEVAIGIALQAWYRDCDDVTVSSSVDHRVYTRYGKTLACWLHGDRFKDGKIPLVMAAEEPEAWGEAAFRIAIMGHYHHLSIKEEAGVTVYQWPSLTGPDDWHSQSGYTYSKPAMCALTVHKENGPTNLLMSTRLRVLERGRLAKEKK